MKKQIHNSIVAKGKSTITTATIKKNEAEKASNDVTSAITESIVADGESEITNAVIDITRIKRKSFWNGFSIGGIIASVVASAFWYFIQRIIENCA